MTDLEKYIFAKRNEFDRLEPSPEVWERLTKELPGASHKTKRFQIRHLFSIAAAVAICLGAFFFVQQATHQTGSTDELSGIDPAYVKQIAYTQEDISSRRTQIKTLVEEHPELAEKFAADLVALDVTYDKLKEKLFAKQNQEVLLQAMISNLKLQVSILEDQLELLQNLKNDIHEKTSNPI